MADAFRQVDVTRVRNGLRVSDMDRAATEEPLEVRLHGHPFAVIMRTPGADRELTAGFLFAERVIDGADDLGTIEYCTDPDNGARRSSDAALPAENIVNVTLTAESAGALDDILRERRQVTTSSACGLCGRLTIESLRVDRPALRCGWTVAKKTVLDLPAHLRSAQAVFEETGGLHAAGLFTSDGRLDGFAEDVGRHNAVDKVIGRMIIAERLPLGDRLLFVSGRTSYEIVQKAFLAGIPVVGAVSAPSSLAVDLARDAGVTLVGFVRGEGFNVYSHADRITG